MPQPPLSKLHNNNHGGGAGSNGTSNASIAASIPARPIPTQLPLNTRSLHTGGIFDPSVIPPAPSGLTLPATTSSTVGAQPAPPSTGKHNPLYTISQLHKTQLASLEQDNPLEPNIKNVWVYNFEEELEKISELLETFPYVAMVRLNFFFAALARLLALVVKANSFWCARVGSSIC